MDHDQPGPSSDSPPPEQPKPAAKPTTSPDPKRPFPWLLTGIVLVIVASASGLVAAVNAYNHSRNLVSASTITTPATKPSPNVLNNQSSATNVWKSTVNPADIPLGDTKVSTTPKVGYVDSCTTTFKSAATQQSDPWINTAAGTWDAATKPAVNGSVMWSNAAYSNVVSGNNRIITTNDLPVNEPTGVFPITPTDPAYQYDRNPNHIAAQNLSYTLPLNPTPAATAGCTRLGPIGVLTDGVVLFNALDAAGRDAVAHEIQDSCGGHPDGSNMYHYHDVSPCLMSKATGSSTLVGYALDGYGIYVERNAQGNLPTNADLDACHGRTSPVMWNGKLTDMYHYDATLEYPYTVGCFHGTPVTNSTSSNPAPAPSQAAIVP